MDITIQVGHDQMPAWDKPGPKLGLQTIELLHNLIKGLLASHALTRETERVSSTVDWSSQFWTSLSADDVCDLSVQLMLTIYPVPGTCVYKMIQLQRWG